MLRAHNELVERLLAGIGDDAPGAARRRWPPSPAATRTRSGAWARTWTEAPGRNRDEYLANVAAGLGRPGGAHGSGPTVACEAYGVIKSFAASLIGIGPADHAPLHRAFCLAFIVLSLPFEFLPLAVATAGKRQERRFVRQASDMLPAWLDRQSNGHRASGTRRRTRMTRPRVVITGIGIVSALGPTRESTWNRMVEGACGIGPITTFATDGYRSRVGAEVPTDSIDRVLFGARAPAVVEERPVRRYRRGGSH